MRIPSLNLWTSLLLLLATSLSALADLKPALEVSDPWIRAVPPSSSSTAAFMTLFNHGDRILTVVGGSTPVAGMVKPMITTQTTVDGKEVMEMKFVDRFDIPPGKKVILAPGGDHLMIMKLNMVPKRGESVKLTISFEYAGKKEQLQLDAPVR